MHVHTHIYIYILLLKEESLLRGKINIKNWNFNFTRSAIFPYDNDRNVCSDISILSLIVFGESFGISCGLWSFYNIVEKNYLSILEFLVTISDDMKCKVYIELIIRPVARKIGSLCRCKTFFSPQNLFSSFSLSFVIAFNISVTSGLVLLPCI